MPQDFKQSYIPQDAMPQNDADMQRFEQMRQLQDRQMQDMRNRKGFGGEPFKRFMQGIDIPGHNFDRAQQEIQRRGILRDLMAPPAPLHKPQTPADWQRSYKQGYAT